jgi:hypothetical protein
VFQQALVAVLSHGAAPELIYLDLRGNPLTEAGTTALVSHAECFDDACMRFDDACMCLAGGMLELAEAA